MLSDKAALEILLSSRLYLYTLFHKSFGGEPTKELLDILCGDSTKDVLEEYADDETMAKLLRFLVSAKEKKLDDVSFLDSVHDEYVRMFYGFDPDSAPLAESAYLSGNGGYFNEVTLSVRDYYRSEGMLPLKYPRVPDDHVSLEMGFMAELAGRALRLFRKGDLGGFGVQIARQRRFLEQHAARWIPLFAEKAHGGKTTQLYPQLIIATGAFVKLDLGFVAEVANWMEYSEADIAAEPSNDDQVVDFASIDQAISNLASLRLPNLEDNEFKAAS